jgi:hypothetical protein
MLTARAITEVARVAVSDVLLGLAYRRRSSDSDPQEAEVIDGDPATGEIVDGDSAGANARTRVTASHRTAQFLGPSPSGGGPRRSGSRAGHLVRTRPRPHDRGIV